jgi:hypothetical protein
MKTLRFFCVVGLLTFVGGSQAWALSSEQSPPPMSGNASNFADPDDEMPSVMVQSSDSHSIFDVAPSSQGQVTAPSMGEFDQGSAAFDRAYAHIQSR